MNILNCIIIDDEEMSRAIIEQYCSKLNHIQIVNQFNNALDAIQFINSNKIDLVFLDIHMPELNGFDFIDSLKNPPNIILTTSDSEFALNAFEYKVGYEIYDDHVPLWENAQIPAINIIDFDYPNLFYNHWHTQNDTPENCSPQSLQQVGTLLLNYVYGKVTK